MAICGICGGEMRPSWGKDTEGVRYYCKNKACTEIKDRLKLKPGLSPNEPVVANEQGGMQSHVPFAFHLLDANATMAIARVFAEGAERYARDNWRLITCEEHLNHALTHIFAALAGDKQDEHLEHAGARMIMAIATQRDGSLEKRPEYVSET